MAYGLVAIKDYFVFWLANFLQTEYTCLKTCVNRLVPIQIGLCRNCADDKEKTEPHASKFVPEYPFQGVSLDLSCHE